MDFKERQIDLSYLERSQLKFGGRVGLKTRKLGFETQKLTGLIWRAELLRRRKI